MINNSKSLAFLATAALLMAVAVSEAYYPYPSGRPYFPASKQPTNYYNNDNDNVNPHEEEIPLLSGSADVGPVHGKGKTGKKPSGSVDVGPVSASGETNPLHGKADAGPVHLSGSLEKTMHGCGKVDPDVKLCAKSGHPGKVDVKAGQVEADPEVDGPVDVEAPFDRLSLP